VDIRKHAASTAKDACLAIIGLFAYYYLLLVLFWFVLFKHAQNIRPLDPESHALSALARKRSQMALRNPSVDALHCDS